MKQPPDYRLSPRNEDWDSQCYRAEEMESLMEQAGDDQEDCRRIEFPEPCEACGDEDWSELDGGLTLQCLNCGWIRPRCEVEEPE